MLSVFENEPYVNFADEVPARKMREALSFVYGQLGKEYPVTVAGERLTTGEKLASVNPAKPEQLVGTAYHADASHAERAIDAATEAFKSWSQVAPEERARYLVKAAAILRRRIYEFSAWLTVESSKNWLEAYADTAEAIDFLEFYAREAIRWGAPHETTPSAGEENEVRYLPLGVGAVISPWNFPLAIMAGMTAAAIATGNTVITKPAEQTPIIAHKFFEVLEEINLPVGVAQLLCGDGEIVGEALTGSPKVRFVCFTGSRDVGVHIYERAAKVQPGQKWLKRSILEMGGKDAIFVDEDADLELAAEGVVASAFGFSGQKCSACSRLIAHTAIYDSLLAKVVERASKLAVGDPAENANLGAVIDLDSYAKIRRYVNEIGVSEGRRVLGNDLPETPDGGYFVLPTIFADVKSDARLAQDEIFGPVLAVIRCENFEEGLAIVNDTDYGLTGAFYSRNRAHIERARREFHVGNFYINRKCTGALVDVQPFGGFNLSGTDSKAGGREYLGLFLQAKSVCERW